MINSLNEFERFQKSSLWADLKGELDIWLIQIHLSMENEDIDDKTYRQLQGSAKAIRQMQKLPEVLIENLKLEMEEQNAETERESE